MRVRQSRAGKVASARTVGQGRRTDRRRIVQRSGDGSFKTRHPRCATFAWQAAATAWTRSPDCHPRRVPHTRRSTIMTALRWFGHSLLVVTAAFASACANDSPVAATSAPVSTAVADVSDGNRLPDLTACPALAAPEGSTLLLHAFGIGVQIYHWNGTSWGAATPAATLYADSAGHGQVATHFAGPSWQSNSGSKVVGTVI